MPTPFPHETVAQRLLFALEMFHLLRVDLDQWHTPRALRQQLQAALTATETLCQCFRQPQYSRVVVRAQEATAHYKGLRQEGFTIAASSEDEI